MKKRTIAKLMASMMALAMVLAPVAGSPMTAHAYAGIDDGCVEERNGGCEGGDFDCSDDSSSSSDSGSVTEEVGGKEANNFNAASGSGTGSSGGSGNDGNGGYGYTGGGSGNGNSEAGDNGWTGSHESGQAASGQASAPTGLACKGSTVCVPGHETWRQVPGAAAGTFSVYHCGIERCTLQLKDADGRPVSYEGSCVAQAEDGNWYISLTTAADVDTTGWTTGTAKGSVAYLSGLGVSGVMVNGVVAAEAAAE